MTDTQIQPIPMEQLADVPEHLATVLSLHRTHSQTLEFMPEGAFEDHRDRRQLLVAILNKNTDAATQPAGPRFIPRPVQ